MENTNTNMHKVFHGIAVAHVVIALVVLGGLALSVNAIKDHLGLAAPSGTEYCSPDGTLSSAMPIQSHRSYCIKSNSKDISFAANTPSSYSFRIVDDQGNTTKDFEITHTKQMHVIVVRKDLGFFQHVHPAFDAATGMFTLSALLFQQTANTVSSQTFLL